MHLKLQYHVTNTRIQAGALAGVVQLVRASSQNQKVAGLTPGQGTYLGYSFNAWSGCIWEATNQCFSLASIFHSLPSCLSKSNEKVSSGEVKNNKKVDIDAVEYNIHL